MERAGVQTCAATDAARTDPVNLGAQGNTFRIVAPGTLQAAALEKHGSPQPGSVFGGHALDFEDKARFRPVDFIAAHSASYLSISS